MQLAGNAGPDQPVHMCRLTESMDAKVYVDEQRLRRSDCSDEYADLDHHCSQ